MLIDSHCHLDRLDLAALGADLDQVLQQAQAQGVERMLSVCVNLETFPAVLAIAERYPYIHASVGVHPDERECQEPSVEELCALAQHPKIVAIGETGLDYFHCKGDVGWQQERFRTHIRAALRADKPLIVHSREAKADTIRILREEGAERIGGVMHCFTEDWEMAQQALALNFYISFSGIVTFKNAQQLRDVAQQMPLDRMLIETDSPYLAPAPHRGKTNQPAYVKHVAECIAGLRSLPPSAVEEATSANFAALFKSARMAQEP